MTGNISQWGENRGVHAVSNSPPPRSSEFRARPSAPQRSPGRARPSVPHVPRSTWGEGGQQGRSRRGTEPAPLPPRPAPSRRTGGERGHRPCPARSRRHESHEIARRKPISAFHQRSLSLDVLHLLFTSLICKRLLSQTALSEIISRHHMAGGKPIWLIWRVEKWLNCCFFFFCNTYTWCWAANCPQWHWYWVKRKSWTLNTLILASRAVQQRKKNTGQKTKIGKS